MARVRRSRSNRCSKAAKRLRARDHFSSSDAWLEQVRSRTLLANGTFGQMILVAENRKKSVSLIVKNKWDILNGNPSSCEDLVRSITMDLHFDHPFIINTISLFQNDTYIFQMVSQCSKFTLDQFLNMATRAGHALDLINIHLFLCQLATALDFIHARHYLLKSLNPKSLLVDRIGNICIADMSMANPKNAPLDQETFPGCLFLAPEVAQGQVPSLEHEESCDFYALGACAYFMTCMTFPSHTVRPLPRIHHDSAFNDFLQKSLVLNPSERLFKSFEDLSQHELFAQVNWLDVLGREFNQTSFFDTMTFDDNPHFNLPLDSLLTENQSLEDEDQDKFIDALL